MASLKEIWKDFQRGPSIDALAEDATLTYITSCKQFSGARAIVDQFSINSQGLKQFKHEEVTSHEAANSLVSEVAASFVFEFYGKMNPFLPGLEDNMISGKRVELPLVYSVAFANRKIRAIRVFWDQATVLKQIEVIGTRGRGWPVYDGSEQSRLLLQDFKPEPEAPRDTSGNASKPVTATHDPHASLQLFEQRSEAPRQDYGPSGYEPSYKPKQSNYDEVFMNEKNARPDELTQRMGTGPQRQVTFGNSGNIDSEMSRVNLNESIGHAGRTSHFEFGTPDPKSSDFQKNEVPMHRKAGIQDHNRTTEESSEFGDRAKPRGPPQPSFDAFSDAPLEHNVHGREYNMSRRPPPQSQYDFVGGEDGDLPKPTSRAASHNYNQAIAEEQAPANVHGREYNMSRRPPPQASYDFTGPDEVAENSNVHGREYNMSRKPPPQAQFDFLGGASNTPSKTQHEGVQEQPLPGGNVHGREYNMSRRPPPQAQYNFMEESSEPAEVTFGRRSQQQQESRQQPEPENIHGREYNMSRRPPPQAQYDFMGDTNSDAQQQNYGRASQRNFTPSYELGNGPEEPENIHGRAYNMGRRGPPAPQNNLFG